MQAPSRQGAARFIQFLSEDLGTSVVKPENMQLPETTNANYIYAFKKGYRYAQEGKKLSEPPSQIRHDAVMRRYFQQGWDQFQAELENGEKAEHESPWRSRLAWLLMAVVAGLGTASLMVNEMQSSAPKQPSPLMAQTRVNSPLPASNNNIEHIEHIEQQTTTLPPQKSAKISPPSSDTSNAATNDNDSAKKADAEPLSLFSPILPPAEVVRHQADKADTEMSLQSPSQKNGSSQTKSAEKEASESFKSIQPTLRLLTPQAHQDLLAQKQAQTVTVKKQPLFKKSDIQIANLQLCEQVQNRQCIHPINNTHIPKYIRKIYLFTTVKNAQGKTLTHRWIYKNQILAEILLPIKSPNFRTWSSKRLSSAWTGQWRVEVLDEQLRPIARKTFFYNVLANPANTTRDLTKQ